MTIDADKAIGAGMMVLLVIGLFGALALAKGLAFAALTFAIVGFVVAWVSAAILFLVR